MIGHELYILSAEMAKVRSGRVLSMAYMPFPTLDLYYILFIAAVGARQQSGGLHWRRNPQPILHTEAF